MLYNNNERRIMQKAIQPGMRYDTAVMPFECIIEDFFKGINLRSQVVLDIGPGQCDFLDIAAQKGAITHGVDMDPAVIELGTLRGHAMSHVINFQRSWPYAPHTFDGLFCRGSLNYFSGYADTVTPETAGGFLDTVLRSAKPDAWIWIVPWVRPAESQPLESVEAILLAADFILRRHNITKSLYTAADIERYEIGFDVPFPQLWTRGLSSAG